MASKSKSKLVSIVINEEFVKLCEVSRNGKVVTVHRVATLPTPMGSYADGVINDVNTLAKAIKLKLDENRFMANEAVFTISSGKLATKDVLIPNVKANKIDKIIQANASEYFPVNIEEYIIQHTLLEKVQEEGQQKLKVMVAAVPSELVEAYYELAKTLGLKVAYVDYAGNSSYHISKNQIGSESTLVMQVENDKTVISIFVNNVLQIQRVVPYGKSLLVNSVMEQYRLGYDEANAKLQNETLLHSRLDGDPITESLRYLSGNINRIINYYVTRNNVSIEKAYVIGNCTFIKGFTTFLSNELHLPVSRIDSLKGVVADKKNYVDEASITTYTTNIGTIFEHVNFIPKKMIEDEKKKGSNRGLVAMLVGAVVISAVLIAVPGVSYIATKTEIASLNSEIDKYKDVEKVVEKYYEAKDRNDDLLAFALLTINNNDSLHKFIDHLEKAVPTDTVIGSMSVTSGSVSMSGKCSSKLSLAKLIQQLEKIPSVSGVAVVSESESKDNTGTVQVSFSLTCSFGTID